MLDTVFSNAAKDHPNDLKNESWSYALMSLMALLSPLCYEHEPHGKQPATLATRVRPIWVGSQPANATCMHSDLPCIGARRLCCTHEFGVLGLLVHG